MSSVSRYEPPPLPLLWQLRGTDFETLETLVIYQDLQDNFAKVHSATSPPTIYL